MDHTPGRRHGPCRWTMAQALLLLLLASWAIGPQPAGAQAKPCSEVRSAAEREAARRAGLCSDPIVDKAADKAAAEAADKAAQKAAADASKRAAVRAAATLSAAAAAAATANPRCQALPDFVGKASTFSQARAELPGALWRARITGSRPSSTPKETILEQSVRPLEGRQCWANFIVSDGTLVRVPALSGLTRDEAARAIAGRQLSADFRDVESESPAGRVVRQNPQVNAEVARGTQVLAQIAQPTTLPIPPLVGLDITAALGRLGPFKSRQQSSASLKPAGEVIAQAPAAGERRPRGTEVALTLSDGSLVEVPKLDRLRIERAQTLLTNAGLSLQRRDRADGAAPGLVLAQLPAAGSAVKRGSAVTLQVSGGLVVPNVVGQQAAAAKGPLQRFTVVTQVEAAEQPANQVIGQTPAASTPVAAGSKVVLRLSDASIVTVPPTQGLPLPEARAGLRQAGDLSGVVGADRDRSNATVEASDPLAGTKVRRGSAVALTVALPTPWWVWVAAGAGVVAAGAAMLGLFWRRPTAHVATPAGVPDNAPTGAPTGAPTNTLTEAPNNAPNNAPATPTGPVAVPPITVSASLEFNQRPIAVSAGQSALPTISLHATLVHVDARIHFVKEPTP